jgi:hypothetical protein
VNRANSGLNVPIPSGLKKDPWRGNRKSTLIVLLKTVKNHLARRKLLHGNNLCMESRYRPRTFRVKQVVPQITTVPKAVEKYQGKIGAAHEPAMLNRN